MKIIYKESLTDKILKVIRDAPPWRLVEKVEVLPEEFEQILGELNAFPYRYFQDDPPRPIKTIDIQGVPVRKVGTSIEDLKARLCSYANLPKEASKGISLLALVEQITKFDRGGYSTARLAAMALVTFIEERHART